jgi:hypothetical protein
LMMLFLTAALLVVLIGLLVMLALTGRGPVPWAQQMRRVPAGERGQAEWMAGAAVVARVQADYRDALGWLQDMAFATPNPHRASTYLCEAALTRYRDIAAQRDGDERFVGVLRAEHVLEVRRFSEDGVRCLVLDHQTNRQMATYDRITAARVGTQALDDVVRVVAMAYDRDTERWKIADDVQQLPVGWTDGAMRRWYQTQVDPLTSVGRDS